MAKLSNELVLVSAANPRRVDEPYVDVSPSMTRQEFAEECDINAIMKRYERTGMIPVNGVAQPMYLDLTQTPDTLMESMNQMLLAEEAFMTLPALVRKEFDNDAMRFVEYASDAANLDRMREWGLAPPAPEEPKPYKVEVVNPAPPAAPEAGK